MITFLHLLQRKSDTEQKLIKQRNQEKHSTIEMRFISRRNVRLCCLSASGNCDHKNVAVERENHKLLSFIKLRNQYKTIFMPMVSRCSMIPTSSCTNHNYFRNGGLSYSRFVRREKGRRWRT